jgi:hypothetical protein
MLLITSLGTESTVLGIHTEATNVDGSFKDAGHAVYFGRRLQMLDLRFVIAQCSNVLGRQYEIKVTFMMVCRADYIVGILANSQSRKVLPSGLLSKT